MLDDGTEEKSMADNLGEIHRDMNRVLEKIFEYTTTSIDSLEEKASHFLSFSLILDSLLAGYVGAVFLLVQLRISMMDPVLNLFLYSAIFCLIFAIFCLLITDIIATRSLSPKQVLMPIEDIDEMKTLHTLFAEPAEWYIHYRERLVNAININKSLGDILQRNVRIMGILMILAAVFFIGFIIFTLVFALGNTIQ